MTEWRPVPGHEGSYEVSDEGDFRSLDRVVRFADGRVRRYPGRPLKLKANADGYWLVSLPGDRANRWRLAHVIVAAAFIGPCPDGQETCHSDGVPSNIRASNLYYGTRKQNHADKLIHGTALFGEKHPSARVSQEVVEAIRRAEGTISEIADRFEVSRTHAWNIRSGQRRNSISEMFS